MDELRMIREAYGTAAPPTPEETGAARALLWAEPAPGVAPAARRAAGPGGFLRRPRFGWRLNAGLGLVAAGAAAAVAVAAIGSGAPDAPSSRPGRIDLDKQAVLAAASKAEQAPTGDYWHSEQIQGQSYIIRPKTGSYAIVGAHSETFTWSGAKSGLGQGFYGRDIPSRPLTPQDEKLWRKDGSPAKFKVFSNDHYSDYGRGKGPWRMDPQRPKDGGTWLDGMTTEQVQDLPTDPGQLAKLFFHGFGLKGPKAKAMAKAGKKDGPLTPAQAVLRVEDVLETAPVPPAVRAGLMRALAAQPGVRALGTAVDPLGRKGVALGADEPVTRITGQYGDPAADRGEYGSRVELIFDAKTGALLAQQRVLTRAGGPYRDQRPGFVINYWVVRDSGWSDAKPKPPADLPF
ncbi:CU044_5270 family protein [Actinomadura roseirufa]|uniref:CU044_5270 family protein n=1 Tax=Actinomadura roseirufa TaxID=2094049 RepID=UPI001041964D|nr:CU044_5270 family protein [Actinomadura roseirufa]